MKPRLFEADEKAIATRPENQLPARMQFGLIESDLRHLGSYVRSCAGRELIVKLVDRLQALERTTLPVLPTIAEFHEQARQ